MPKNETFNPQEHIITPKEEGLAKLLDKKENIFSPESYIALRVIVSKEQAHLIANAQEIIRNEQNPEKIGSALMEVISSLSKNELILNAFQKQLGEKLTDLNEAHELLALVESKTDQEAVDEMIKRTRGEINILFDSVLGNKEVSPTILAEALAHSGLYKIFLERLHGIDRSKLLGYRYRELSEEEREETRKYDCLVIGLLEQAQNEQETLLRFLEISGFKLPPLPKDMDKLLQVRLKDNLAAATKRNISNNYMISPTNKCDNNALYAGFEKNFRRLFHEQELKGWDDEIKNFITHLQSNQTLERIKAFKIEITPSTPSTPTYKRNEDFEMRTYWGGGAPASIDIRYDVDSIKKCFGKEAKRFIVPGIPEKVTIKDIPLADYENFLKVVISESENFKKILQEALQNPEMLEGQGGGIRDAHWKLQCIGKGLLGLNTKHLIESKGQEEPKISMSDKFLRFESNNG